MKKIIIAIFTLLVCTQVDAQKRNIWFSLFDGVSTTGWHSYGEKTAGAAWKGY